MPQYAIEGGKLHLAEALFSKFKYIIRCPTCPGIPGKPGFFLDSAGKPDANGFRRRAWACTWSNSSKTRCDGRRKCRRLQVSDFILLAVDSLAEDDFQSTLLDVSNRLDPADERYKALQAYSRKATPVVIPFQPVKPRKKCPLQLLLPPSPPTSSSPPTTDTALIVKSSPSNNKQTPYRPRLRLSTPSSESSDEQEIHKRTPRTPVLAIIETPEVPPVAEAGNDLFLAPLSTRKRGALSESDDCSTGRLAPNLANFPSVGRHWKGRQEIIEDNDEHGSNLPRLPSSPCAIPASSSTFTNISTSPTLRILQVQRQTRPAPPQKTTRRPRKKAKLRSDFFNQGRALNTLHNFLRLDRSSSQ